MIRAALGVLLVAATVIIVEGCGSNPGAALREVQRVNRGGLAVVLLSEDGALRQGGIPLTIEFRNASGDLVDVGAVTVNASMAMAGMGPMLGETKVSAGDRPGRYVVESDFHMAGAWRVTVDWKGATGRESVTFPTTVP